MPLTPSEIRHLEFKRAWFRGVRKSAVEAVLDEIADSFEQVWRESAERADRLEELENDAVKHRELEALLRSTLVSAERAAQDMKEQARRESDLIVQEAHAEGRRVTRQSTAEKQRLDEETRKIRAMLRTALEALRDAPEEDEGEVREEESKPRPASVDDAPEGGIRKIAG
jgi:cell division initiation protein